MNRSSSLFIAVMLILVVGSASLSILYEKGFLTGSNETEPRILWQSGIEEFATGLAAVNGRVYTIDIFGTINCYKAQTGNSVWSGSVGAYFAKGVTASGDRVYGGKQGAQVGALDAATGKFQWSVRAPDTTGYWSKSAPSNISAIDDRMFATADGVSVFNAATGQLLWKYETHSFQLDTNVTHPNWLKAWAFDGNRVFATGGAVSNKYYVYRLDPDHGTILWNTQRSTYVSGPPVVYEGQVIMWNSSQGQTTVFSLNETSGATFWNHNVEASIYQPTADNDLVVFETYDGDVYALHLSDGTLAWKTHVDSQNIISLANSDNPLKGLAIQIDHQNQRAIGGYAVTTQLGGGEYSGFLCSLDLDDGSIVWNTQFLADGDISHENALFNFALTKNDICLTTGFYDFWIFSKSTGNMIKFQHFAHYILPPVAADNKVFVAADLRLFAYE